MQLPVQFVDAMVNPLTLLDKGLQLAHPGLPTLLSQPPLVVFREVVLEGHLGGGVAEEGGHLLQRCASLVHPIAPHLPQVVESVVATRAGGPHPDVSHRAFHELPEGLRVDRTPTSLPLVLAEQEDRIRVILSTVLEVGLDPRECPLWHAVANLLRVRPHLAYLPDEVVLAHV